MLFLLYLILVIFKLPLYKFKEYLITSKYAFKVIVINSFIVIITLVSFYNFDTVTLLENIIFILISVLIILLVNIIAIIFQRENLIKQKRIETIET